VFVDDFIEINPTLQMSGKLLKDAIFFKFPNEFITKQDTDYIINIYSEYFKDYCAHYKKDGKNYLPSNFKIDSDLSFPPYDNVVYFYNQTDKLYMYWLVVIPFMGNKVYSIVPMIVEKNKLLNWVKPPEEEIDFKLYPTTNQLYRINYNYYNDTFAVNLSHIMLSRLDRTKILHDNHTLIQAFVFTHFVLKMSSILNCKNIETVKIKPTERLQKRRQKKGKLPIQSYNVLKLKGVSKKYETITDKIDPQWKNRIHLCRGHFKSYTAEKPLLGKYIGLWWWQPIVRGKNKKGVIFKDYEKEI